MTTRDAVAANSPTSLAESRGSEAIEPLTQDETWQPLRERFNVVVQPFAQAASRQRHRSQHTADRALRKNSIAARRRAHLGRRLERGRSAGGSRRSAPHGKRAGIRRAGRQPATIAGRRTAEPRCADIRRRRQIGAHSVYDRKHAAARVHDDRRLAHVQRRRSDEGSPHRAARPHERFGRLEAEGDRRLHGDAWKCRSKRTKRSPTTTSSPCRFRFARKSCACWSSSRCRAGSIAICATPCRAIRASSSRACCFTRASTKSAAATRTTSRNFPARSKRSPNTTWCSSATSAWTTTSSRSTQCRMLRGLVEFQASGLVFLPGIQGRAVLAARYAAQGPVPGRARRHAAERLGHAHAEPFPTHRARRAQPAHEAGRFAAGKRRRLGQPARLPMVRTGRCAPKPAPKCCAFTATPATTTAACRSWSRKPSAPAKCSSWAPTAPGAGARASKTSITIASGARSSAGWPTSATWPRAKRCGSTIRPTSRSWASRSR